MRVFLSSGKRILFPEGFTQALAFTFGLLLSIPSPRELTSPSEPSSLQLIRGVAATIQFPHGMRGDTHIGGILHEIEEAHQKHAAIPTAPVIVGVT